MNINPTVPHQDDDGLAVHARQRPAGDARQLDGERFQAAQTAPRLGEPILVGLRRRRSGLVGRGMWAQVSAIRDSAGVLCFNAGACLDTLGIVMFDLFHFRYQVSGFNNSGVYPSTRDYQFHVIRFFIYQIKELIDTE